MAVLDKTTRPSERGGRRWIPWAILTLLLWLSSPTPVHACSLLWPDQFTIGDEPNPDDVTPPSAVEVSGVEAVYRDDDCGDRWDVELFVSATDDLTATPDLGYIVLDARDLTPSKLADGNWVFQAFEDGRHLVQLEPNLKNPASVCVHAVDRVGNVGPCTEVDIPLEDGPGCSVSARPRGAGSAGWLALGLLALGGLARRHTARR